MDRGSTILLAEHFQVVGLVRVWSICRSTAFGVVAPRRLSCVVHLHIHSEILIPTYDQPGLERNQMK